MAPSPAYRSLLSLPQWLLLLLLTGVAGRRAEPSVGSAVPAQSRRCVDCQAFEFVQHTLQDLWKTGLHLEPGRAD